MRRLITPLLASAFVLTGAIPLAAQEEEEPGLVHVQVFKVAPAHGDEFEAAVTKVVEAANQADLSPEFAWQMYSENGNYHLVTWPESMAEFDKEGEFEAQFVGTPGEATLQEAFSMFEELHVTTESFILDTPPDWTYMPEGGMEMSNVEGIMVFQAWVAPGKYEAYEENTKELMGLLAEMNFTYPVIGHRTMIGDQGRTSFVVPHDGLANFYGENNMEAHLERSGLGDQWSALFEKRMELVRKLDSFPAVFRAELSYNPEGT